MLGWLRSGFDIFIDPSIALSKPGRNPPASEVEKQALDAYFEDAVASEFCVGPFPSHAAMEAAFGRKMRVKPVFAVYSGSKYRAVVNFSSPKRAISLNSAMLPAWTTVQYIQMQQLVRWLEFLGPSAWIWIIDLQNAYLQLKVKSEL